MPLTYLNLTGPKSEPYSLHNWVNYKKVPVTVVVEEAQALIYSMLRIREMRASATITLNAAASSVALPAGFLEPISMVDREGWEVIPDRFVEPTGIASRRTYTNDVLDTGVPLEVSIFDESFQWACKAEAQRKFDLVYYKAPDSLGPSNTTNFLTSRYPHLLRVACQARSASFMKDAAEFKDRFEELSALINSANAESDLGRAS